MERERVGGTARLADRIGFVRTESFGTLFSRSVDLVSSFRRLGALGRRGGGGRRKPIDEGGGEGVASLTLRKEESVELVVRDDDEDVVVGIIGRGDRGSGSGEGGLEAVEEFGSSSGSFFDRRAESVSSWKSPREALRPFTG